MKKTTKKNRKYVMGSRKITSVHQFQRVAQVFLRKHPFAQSIRVSYCGKTKVIMLQ